MWKRARTLWQRTDRARAVAQIPVVALTPAVGPVANQVRLAPTPEPAAIRQDATLDQQKQWAHHELGRIAGRPTYVVRDPANTSRTRKREGPERDR
jgi:hypothetical protein